jgi:serine/threonine protein kinase
MNSTVFLAYDPVLKRDVAVKEITKSRFGNDFDSYCEEARTMFDAADPNIVGIEFVCETADCIALALPYFQNGSLHKKIELNPLGLLEFMKLTQAVASGLARIHICKFLHLDLKPTNVLLDDFWQPLITDFGQCRRMSPAGIVTYPQVYKFSMPPEMLNSHTATVESDIYQFGLLLYRAANGNLIYELQKAMVNSDGKLLQRIEKGRFPDRNFFLPHIPGRVRTIVRKALNIDPKKRYRSAFEIAKVMGRVQLSLDWQTISTNNGGYVWRAKRSGRDDLEVKLILDSPKRWKTEVWIASPQRYRRKNVSGDWKRSLNYKEAMKHLTEVFVRLGQ